MELVDNMFDELDTPGDLFSCSVVCRNWHAFAQARLFSRIQLDSSYGKPPVNTVHKFYQLLSASPHIASHVREVTICVRALDCDAKIPWVLSKLSNLRSLKIRGSGRVVWKTYLWTSERRWKQQSPVSPVSNSIRSFSPATCSESSHCLPSRRC